MSTEQKDAALDLEAHIELMMIAIDKAFSGRQPSSYVWLRGELRAFAEQVRAAEREQRTQYARFVAETIAKLQADLDAEKAAHTKTRENWREIIGMATKLEAENVRLRAELASAGRQIIAKCGDEEASLLVRLAGDGVLAISAEWICPDHKVAILTADHVKEFSDTVHCDACGAEHQFSADDINIRFRMAGEPLPEPGQEVPGE